MLRRVLAVTSRRLLTNIRLCSTTPPSFAADPTPNETFSQETSSEDPFRDPKQSILEAALLYVPQHGWTDLAIGQGARDLNLSSMMHGMYERGPVELVEYFVDKCNDRLTEELAVAESFSKMRPTEQLHAAVKTRLGYVIPYKSSWSQALALMAQPQNVPHALQRLGTLVDNIWYLAGDRSEDFNWYTKRALLAGVYTSTELYLLQDQSVDHQDTWDFLNRAIDGSATIGKGSVKMRETVEYGATIITNTLISLLPKRH